MEGGVVPLSASATTSTFTSTLSPSPSPSWSSVETAARCLRLCQRGFHAHAALLQGGLGPSTSASVLGLVERLADAEAGGEEEKRLLEETKGCVDARDVVHVDGYVDYWVGKRSGVGDIVGGAGVAYFDARAFEEAPGGGCGDEGEGEGARSGFMGGLAELLCREPSPRSVVDRDSRGVFEGEFGVLPEVGDAEVEASLREERGWDGRGVTFSEREDGGDDGGHESQEGEILDEPPEGVGHVDEGIFDDVDAMARGVSARAVPPQWETFRRGPRGDASLVAAAVRQPLLSGHGVGLAMSELHRKMTNAQENEGGEQAQNAEEDNSEADLVRRCLLATCGVPSRAFEHLVFNVGAASKSIGGNVKLGALRPRLPSGRGLFVTAHVFSRGGGVSRNTLGSCMVEFSRAGNAVLSLEYVGAVLTAAPGHVARALGSAVAQYLQVFRAAVLQAANAAARRRGEAVLSDEGGGRMGRALGSMSALEALAHTRALRAQVRAVDAIVRAVLDASVAREAEDEAPGRPPARIFLEGDKGDLSEYLQTLAAFSPAVARLLLGFQLQGATALDVLHAQLQVCGRDLLTAPVVRALFVTVARPILHHVHCWTTQVRVEDAFNEFPLSTGPNPARDAACPPVVVPQGGHAWWQSRLLDQASPAALPHVFRGVADEVVGCGRSISLLFAHPRTRDLAVFIAASAPPLGQTADAISAATFRGEHRGWHSQHARLVQLQAEFSEAADAELARLSSQIALAKAQETAQRAGMAASLQKALEGEEGEEEEGEGAEGDGASDAEGHVVRSKRMQRLSEAAVLAEREAAYWRGIVEERTRSLEAVQRKIKGQRWLQLRAAYDEERVALWKQDSVQWRAELLRVQREQEALDAEGDGLVAKISKGESSLAPLKLDPTQATPSQKMAAAGVSAGNVLNSAVAVKNEGTVQGQRGSASGGGSGARAKDLLYPDSKRPREDELEDIIPEPQRGVNVDTEMVAERGTAADDADEAVDELVNELVELVALEGDSSESAGSETDSSSDSASFTDEVLADEDVAAVAVEANVQTSPKDGMTASVLEVQDSPVEALLSLSVERIVLSVSRVTDKGCALLLLRNCALRDHMAAMRRYLLFAAGDFADSFCDGLFKGGGASRQQLPSTTLQHLVDDSVGQSVFKADPLAKKGLKAFNSTHRSLAVEGKGSERYAGSGMGMTELLMGGDDDDSDSDLGGARESLFTKNGAQKEMLDDYDYVSLTYDPEWPSSIVLSTDTCVDGYARVFRFLLRLARMRTVLRDLYAQTSELSGGRTGELDWAKQRSCVLFRHEVQHFIGILHAYLMSQVVDVSWSELCVDMDALESEMLQEGGKTAAPQGSPAPGACFVERLVRVHEAYLARMKQRCLLDPDQRPVRLLIEDTFQRLLDFRTQLERDLAGGASSTETFRNVYRMHSAFRRNTEFLYQVLAKVAGETGGGKGVAHVRDLLVRLNYNEFFQDG